MNRLFIGEDEVDLYTDSVVPINYQINDLATPDDRQANFSQQFKIPMTNNNRRIFENVQMIQSESVLPYRKIYARYVSNGIEIIPRALIIVNSSDTNYNVTLYSGNIFLANVLAGLKLADLDFSGLSHIRNRVNIFNTRGNTYADGYIYGVVEFCASYLANGDLDLRCLSLGTWETKYALPQLFVKYIFNKIMSAVGIRMYGAFFDTDIFKGLLFQTCLTDKPTTGGLIYRARPSADGSFDSGAGEYNSIAFDEFTGGDIIARTGFIDIPGWHDAIGGFIQVTQDIDLPANCRIKLSVTVFYENFANSIINLELSINGVLFAATPDQFFNVGDTGNYTWVLDIPVDPAHAHINAGDVITWKIHHYDAGTPWTVRFLQDGSFVEIYDAVGIETVYGSLLDMQTAVPDMLQYDFVKGVMQMFGLSIKTDKLSSDTAFGSLKELMQNKDKAVDWSDKLDNTSRLTTYKIGSYAQRNWFKYMADSAVDAGFGDGYIDIDDQTLALEKIVLTLPWAACLTKISNPNVPIVDAPIVGRYDFDDNLSIDVQPRMFLMQRTGLANVLNYRDDAGTNFAAAGTWPVCSFISNTYGNKLGFNNSLLDDWYAELKSILNKAKMIQALFKLTEIDIYQLDQFIPIYLSQFSAHFYVNQVANFTGKGLTKAYIIRL